MGSWAFRRLAGSEISAGLRLEMAGVVGGDCGN